MNNIKDHENLNKKKVLLRLDLNVPLKNGVITDQTRINKILPIIDFLLSKNSQIIIIFDFFLSKYFNIGKTLSILVSSVIIPFLIGTFKSNLNKTNLLSRFS